ncbi:hypothetical protein [Streptomyces blastmyceticus]|uniref:Lipoprotein n=1 Tax=Streptomyces blastmyceticus TaxID=68180 RepID=A0ABP3HRN5_9ACTN
MPTSATKVVSALTVSAAAILLTACGTDHEPAKAVVKPSDQPSTTTPLVVETGGTSSSPTASVASGDHARQEEQQRRKASVPKGHPVEGKTTIPSPEDYGYGKPGGSAENGDVLVYEPKKENGLLRIPVTVTNHGDKRAFYKVTITLTGSNGSSVTAYLDTSTTGVYPGTTWPTELNADDTAHPLSGKLKATITSSSRQER